MCAPLGGDRWFEPRLERIWVVVFVYINMGFSQGRRWKSWVIIWLSCRHVVKLDLRAEVKLSDPILNLYFYADSVEHSRYVTRKSTGARLTIRKQQHYVGQTHPRRRKASCLPSWSFCDQITHIHIVSLYIFKTGMRPHTCK